ncbi:hypothetical protein BCV72DRAFT_207170, partial [Rhizopus microsporus var. microsporus]
GGKWKENMHTEAINVCVTNENKTSQICVFCFKKLAHPKPKEIKMERQHSRVQIPHVPQ